MDALKRGADGFQLKLFALAVMTIDHIYYFLNGPLGVPYFFTLIGRIAAPIFLFFCVEGFSYTRSKPKYLARMYLFSVGMKFADMTLATAFPRPDHVAIMNDMFSTMFVVCWCIAGIELLRDREAGKRRWLGALMLAGMLAATVLLVACMITPVLPQQVMQFSFLLLPNPFTCEGGFIWVLLGILLFYARKSKWKTVLAMAAVVILNLGLIPVDLDVLIYFGCTFAGILPVCLYNGKPGKHRCKWLFYIYYPAHVYVLYLVSWWMLTR